MAIIAYHGGTGTYFELTDDVYIAEVSGEVLSDEDQIQTAAIVDGFPVTPESARAIYELMLGRD